jgi:hypothetical protein
MRKPAPCEGAGEDRNQAATTEAICTPSLPQDQVATTNGRSASMLADQISLSRNSRTSPPWRQDAKRQARMHSGANMKEIAR